MSDNDNADLQAERDRLQTEIIRLQVARDYGGMPVSMLGEAATVEDARAAAEVAMAWKSERGSAPGQPATGAATTPSYSVNQISRATFDQLDPQTQMAMVRAGRCVSFGVGIPQDVNGIHR